MSPGLRSIGKTIRRRNSLGVTCMSPESSNRNNSYLYSPSPKSTSSKDPGSSFLPILEFNWITSQDW